jgi:hypothetical protein
VARRAEICPGQIYRWRRELSVTLRVRPPPVSGLIRAGCGSVEATPVKEMVRWRGFSLSGALIAPAFAPCAIVAQVARPAEVCPLASSMMMAADRAQKTVSGQPFGLTRTLPLFIAFLSASVATCGSYVMGIVVETVTTPLNGFNTGFMICGVICWSVAS